MLESFDFLMVKKDGGLQVMLTKGEAIKADAKKGMPGNYYERKVELKIID